MKPLRYMSPLRLITLLLTVSLLMAGMALPAFAVKGDPAEYVDWEYYPLTDKLKATFVSETDDTPETVTYHPYDGLFSPCLLCMPSKLYQYENTVTIDEDIYTVSTASYGSDIALLQGEGDGAAYVYFTDDGMEKAIEFCAAREFSRLRFYDSQSNYIYDYVYDLDDDFLARLQELSDDRGDSIDTTAMTVSAVSLRYATYYEVLGFDEDDWLAMSVARLYELDGVLYYLDVLDLTIEQYARLDENSAYATDTVTLYPLTSFLDDTVQEAIYYADVWQPTIVYEGDTEIEDMVNDFMGTDEDIPEGLVYVTIVFLGILLPIAPLTVGLVLPHTKKNRGKRRWYALAAIGGTWLLLGVLILVLIGTIL